MRSIALAVLLIAPPAFAYGEKCYSNAECSPAQVCTVSLGDCGDGDAPLDVCTGHCVAGESWRFVPRLSAGQIREFNEPAIVAAELEVVPPVLGGVPSLSFVILPIERAAHAGAGASFTYSGLRASAYLSAFAGLPRAPGGTTTTTGWLARARLEFFPLALWNYVTPFHHLSLSVEGGMGQLREADVIRLMPHLLVGLGWWL